jgi:hypothetical protein
MNFTNRPYFNVTIPHTLFTPMKPALRAARNLRVYTATDGLKNVQQMCGNVLCMRSAVRPLASYQSFKTNTFRL